LIDWMEGKIAEHRSSGRQARYTMEILMVIESLRIKMWSTCRSKPENRPRINGGRRHLPYSQRDDIRAPFPEQVVPCSPFLLGLFEGRLGIASLGDIMRLGGYIRPTMSGN
ncbi:hypothetical protein KFU94_23455, partial [Chloroflexi bacterium TSY]|nr:hypothetical protein [Chloroflexi bacterium TSY]